MRLLGARAISALGPGARPGCAKGLLNRLARWMGALAAVGWIASAEGARADAAPSPEPDARIARSPEVPWRAPDLEEYTQALVPSHEPALLDPDRDYALPELIDLAERLDPDTRVAWEGARQAALAQDLVMSQYLPVLALAASVGARRLPLPAPKNLVADGYFDLDYRFNVVSGLSLRWLLLDFGGRRAAWDAAAERLLAANLGFNAKHQQLVFAVEQSFYALTSVRGKIDVAHDALASAVAVREAAEQRSEHGLATDPELLLACQQEAQAAFDLEDVSENERDAQVALARAIGLLPTTPIRVLDFWRLEIPTELESSVETTIDRALANRPDLIAKVAEFRAREHDVRKARAEYFPTVSLTADAGGVTTQSNFNVDGHSSGASTWARPAYGAAVLLKLPLYEGGALATKVALAESAERAAEHELRAARDEAIRQVWKAYTDTKLALRRVGVAKALVDASEKAYQSTFESYDKGLETLTNLLAARRELSRARYSELDAKVRVLEASVSLSFATGELAPPPPSGATP